MPCTAATGVTDAFGLVLSTTEEAAAAYQQGVRHLLAERPEALLSFARAARADRSFALAPAGLALAGSIAGRAAQYRAVDRARAAARLGNRRERQHVEIVAAAITGPPQLALALTIKHLDEFPEDVVVLMAARRAVTRTADRRLCIRLRKLVDQLFANWSAVGAAER